MKQAVQFLGCMGIACLVVYLAHLAIDHSEHRHSAENSGQRMELRIDLPVDPNSVSELEVAAQNHAHPVLRATPAENEFKRQLKAFDSFKANAIATTHFNKSEWEAAAEWYLNALDYDPSNSRAAEGLVMSAFEAGKYREAYQSSVEYLATNPELKTKLIKSAADEVHNLIETKQLEAAEDILKQFPEDEFALSSSRALLDSLTSRDNPRAQETNDDSSTVELGGYYTTRSWDIGSQTKPDAIPREAYLIRGWSLFHVGEYEDAAQVFEKLYKTQADIESARGIVASLRAGGDLARLNRLADQLGGRLAKEISAGAPAKQDQIY